ncbi:2-isopropylmalate synthase [Syntrophobotulus glycolicus DSM 8271]|uniref:2-isopropylmalate synthase n=1 Tax=Syntrophobotulus glycolicus (strain DSM 8271 / FlGlyR) TaxID=645991 RepID=F0T2P5_SYNGF|nr:2-isopropylmalate synthase [Syntrophobotulus glycolicus]ADY56444.1 2-isopropylmalate synthase [Syntrophobotulus glycolicus DSM 8271]
MRQIEFFDTTLRDGEQSPGVALNVEEKLQIARQLEKLGVDIIEAGFPITSPGDFQAVSLIAEKVRDTKIAGLARAEVQDIERAWEALKKAESPRIHTFIATSPIHMQYKLRKTKEQVLEHTKMAVELAKSKVSDVEFSAEDASRSEVDFLAQVFSLAIKSGATVLNIPDTVGYAVPDEFAEFVKAIMTKTEGIEKVKVSVHCHNDLGLAVANSLAAVKAGIQQIECAVNGLGERAGNAALEELAMALYTRKDQYMAQSRIVTREITKTSRLVSRLSGMSVQHNKSIVGKNAFAHEAGIHQDGVLKERSTYEIISPEMIGLDMNTIVLGKHSGRHALRKSLDDLGIDIGEERFQKLFEDFKVLAEKKKVVTSSDLFSLADVHELEEELTIDYWQVVTGNNLKPTATIGLQHKNGEEKEELIKAAYGDGPVAAAYKAIDKIVGIDGELLHYNLQAIDSGEDSQGEVNVTVKFREHIVAGRGISTDIIEASVKAYLQAVNRALGKGWVMVKKR